MKRYKTAPCKDCGFRQIGCHISCKPYIDFQEYLAEVKAIKKEAQERSCVTSSYQKRKDLAIRRGEKC